MKGRAVVDERGSISTQLVVLLPLMLGIVWIAMSAAMYYYGRTAALSSAQSGVTAGAAENGTEADCHTAASDLLARVGDALQGATVSCVRTTTTMTATVSGTTLSLVPGWSPTVSQTATAPVERLTR